MNPSDGLLCYPTHMRMSIEAQRGMLHWYYMVLRFELIRMDVRA